MGSSDKCTMEDDIVLVTNARVGDSELNSIHEHENPSLGKNASAAVRFDNHSGERRPVIFWDKQAGDPMNRKQKKFKHQGKEQQFPLRTPKPVQAQEPQPRRRDDKSQANGKPVPDQVTKEPANKKSAGRHYGAKKKKVPETAGTVVLTQKEFDAILDTIGHLALEAEMGPKTKTAEQTREQMTTREQITAAHKPDVSMDPGVSIELSPADGVHNVEPSPRNNTFATAKFLSPSPELAIAKELPPSPEPGSYSTRPTKLTTNTYAAPPSHQMAAPAPPSHQMAAPAPPSHQVAANAVVRTSMEKPLAEVIKSVRGVPTGHMTKAEKKRIQWERERAEESKQTEWDPWGRPGAGAPVRDNGGNLQADYKTRASTQLKKAPISMMQTAPIPTVDTTPVNRGWMNSTTPAAVTTGVMPPPAAIRSSLVIGHAEPNENRFESAKDRQRKEWLADLEKQREEQRQRKVSEKTFKQEGETYDTWADHFSTYKPAGLPNQQTSKPVEVTPRDSDVGPEASYGRVNSAPVVPPLAPPVQQTSPKEGDDTRTFIRGQNVYIDPTTIHELEDKRKKQLEHQEFIRKQIEEKEQLKRAEKEQRMKEEQEEENRLRQERDLMNGQVQQERDKARAKEDLEKQRLDALKQAMEQAQEFAEREKHAKRMRKLQRAGHDTSRLNANFEAKMTPRAEALTSGSTGHVVTSPRDMYILDQSHMEPSPRQDMDQSYGGQRVLTPTKFRQTPASEPPSPRHAVLMVPGSGRSGESADIVYKGPVLEKKKKQVRVISAPKQQTRSKFRVKSAPLELTAEETKRPIGLKERPGWGQNPKKKRPVKQSEKDPFYEQKLRKRELVGQLRQEEMLRMADKHCPKTYKVTTASSRARSRSRSNERDGHRSRSRSPPRTDTIQGRRSQKDSQSRPSDSPMVPRNASRNSSLGQNHRSVSPPIPTIRHRGEHADNYSHGNYSNTRIINNYAHRDDMTSRTASRSDQVTQRDKYQDEGIIQAPVKNNDFVPFIRSCNVLDPAHAESPMPLSREPSVMERARKAYVQEHDPAKFGFLMDNYRDDLNKRTVPPQLPSKNMMKANDPILNPELVKEHPTSRQSQILQHLSDLRRGLMQKQRELELDQGIMVE